jgi:histidinol-phosphatase (PHP family)
MRGGRDDPCDGRSTVPEKASSPCAGLGDYHVHTHWSDGEGEPAEWIERALELGLREIGFSDHLVPPSVGVAGAYGVPLDRVGEYVDEVHAAAARYPQIRVLVSVEADYLPGREPELAETLGAFPFDYVIGSVHFVGDFDFADETRAYDPRWDDVDAVFRGYYEATRLAAECGLFDIMAHVGYVGLWGHSPGPGVAASEAAALQAIADTGMVLEINTGGPLDPLGSLYPSPSQLERARRLGIRVTLSSDAHSIADLGMLYADGVVLAREAGYDSVVRMSDRSDTPLPG